MRTHHMAHRAGGPVKDASQPLMEVPRGTHHSPIGGPVKDAPQQGWGSREGLSTTGLGVP